MSESTKEHTIVYGATGDASESALPAGAETRRESVQRALLAWYAREGRGHLPWRHTRDPYAVLVSEMMLQQTQVERVLPKYQEFLRRFPSLADLAAAPTSDVIKAWAGLGYNTRAVRLQEVARRAVASHAGELPATLAGQLALPGIGRYTAGAVACFAFGLRVATVDTNVRRVLWRVFRGIEPAVWPGGERAGRDTLALAEWALPPDDAYDWQPALMDLGATVCAARRPACERCPLVAHCSAFAETARVTLFPSGEALARLRDDRAAMPARQDGTLAGSRVAESGAEYTPDSDLAPRAKKPRPSAQPFTSTSRYFRGRVVDALRALPHGESLALAALGPLVRDGFADDELPWLRRLVTGLARDGLVRIVDGHSDAETRVLLP